MTSRSWVLTSVARHLVQEMAAHVGDVMVVPPQLRGGLAAVDSILQPRRWVVERTNGWINHCRRLDRHHEVILDAH